MNVVVTGANRGIGLGFVQHYLAQGHQAWAGYRSSKGGLTEIKDPNLHLVQWDVTEEKSADFVTTAGLPATIDILINNAGIYGPKDSTGQSLQAVDARTMHEVFDVDCVGPLRVVQLLWPNVARAKGIIVNMSSKMGSSGDNSSGGSYAYRAAKAALVIVSKSMAIDLAGKGIRVITLHPGWVRTDMTDHSGLIDVDQSVSGLTSVIQRIDEYDPGAFVAFDGKVIPY